MKEYICKEDMRKAITDSISECQGSYDAVKRQHEIIDEMLKLPTVTKADISSEVIDEFKKRVVEVLLNLYLVDDKQQNEFIDYLIDKVEKISAEMEQGE